MARQGWQGSAMPMQLPSHKWKERHCKKLSIVSVELLATINKGYMNAKPEEGSTLENLKIKVHDGIKRVNRVSAGRRLILMAGNQRFMNEPGCKVSKDWLGVSCKRIVL
jgi:hypothetical protein